MLLKKLRINFQYSHLEKLSIIYELVEVWSK